MREAAGVQHMPEGARSPGAGAAGVEVVLEVPRILSDCTGGKMQVLLRAETIASALVEVGKRWPTLATHICDESWAIRQHVLLLHNGRLTKYYKSLDVPLRAGDRLQIVQAVSGG